MSNYTMLVPIISIGIILSSLYKGINYRKDKNAIDINRYISENGTNNTGCPIMWIYITSDMYSIDWNEFGSRIDNDLQPYISLCIKSIIEKCGEDFNVVLVNDNSLSSILPEWDIDMENLSNPLKKKIRDIAVTKILYLHGGLFVPPTLLSTKSLIEPYNTASMQNKILIGEISNKTIMSSYVNFAPSLSLIGCDKGNKSILKLGGDMEAILSSDYTNESVFNGDTERIMMNMFNDGKLYVLDGESIGIKDDDGYMVTIDRLLGSSYVPFKRCIYGVYIPIHDVVNSHMYNWLMRMSVEELMMSKTIIGEMFRHN